MIQNEFHSNKFIKIHAGENELSNTFLLASCLLMLSAILVFLEFFCKSGKKTVCQSCIIFYRHVYQFVYRRDEYHDASVH